MNSINLKCYARLSHDWNSRIEAILIAFVPSPEVRTERMNMNRKDLSCKEVKISQDCIVRLMSFNKNHLYQVPLECVEIVDEWNH